MRLPSLLALAAAALLLIGGCTTRAVDASAGPIGSTRYSLDSGAISREYRVYRPAGLPDGAPLVVVLHGGYGSAAQAERSYGWNDRADTDGFVVAYPDGLARAWNTEGGDCCGPAQRRSVDDVAFITAMLDRIGHDYGIDPERVYATGMSNGAMMTYTLACRTDRFAALAPVAGTQLDDCPGPAPVSLLHIHGSADPVVRYDGSPGDNVGTVIDGPPIPALNQQWLATDGCPTPTITTTATVTTSRADCPGGREVTLITIDGAGHQWPGTDHTPPRERLLHTDPSSSALDATATIAEFFARHHR
ncbi:alpha/beta hydrolase family esterase [Nocardia asteroides]|uniref:alpha/beta hydrolase family esterase n=1 Tax=Nocardia asteroides TaxID=1824 RepID=UPI001E35BC61|nr:PHB depolymerase family esterase [Nocardia asteroides]UGT63395.1 prolyl oligopeptidase family serine peptidase [Nocardia asteroides]